MYMYLRNMYMYDKCIAMIGDMCHVVTIGIRGLGEGRRSIIHMGVNISQTFCV